jgi:hypothetical protein
MLATGPKGRFKPGQDDGLLMAIKIRSIPSFGWEVKPEVSCLKIVRDVKDLLKYHGDEYKFSFPSPILVLAPEVSLLTGPPDSTGGCQSSLVDELGVSSSRYHHTMVHIANNPGMSNRPVEAAVLRRQSHPIVTNLPGKTESVIEQQLQQ